LILVFFLYIIYEIVVIFTFTIIVYYISDVLARDFLDCVIFLGKYPVRRNSEG